MKIPFLFAIPSQVFDCKMATAFPVIKSFYDVFRKWADLKSAVESQPDQEMIYHIGPMLTKTKVNITDMSEKREQELKERYQEDKKEIDLLCLKNQEFCIAGSAAMVEVLSRLKYVMQKILGDPEEQKDFNKVIQDLNMKMKELGMIKDNLLLECIVQMYKGGFFNREEFADLTQKIKKVFYRFDDLKLNDLSFTANDTDIFIMNSNIQTRVQLGNIDFVYTRDKTPGDVISHFDLPCCRAATNAKFEFWISSHCLYALMKGIYYMPAYVYDEKRMVAMFNKYRGDDPMTCGERFLFLRIHDRMDKYKKRGIGVKFFNHDKPLEWIVNRFHYGVWSSTQQHSLSNKVWIIHGFNAENANDEKSMHDVDQSTLSSTAAKTQ